MSDDHDRLGRPEVPPRARGPLSARERDRIRALAHDGLSVREIAAETGRGRSTVSRVAGDQLAERREQTEAATETARVDGRSRRTALAAALLDDVEAARVMFTHQTHPQFSAWAVRAISGLVSAHTRLIDVDRAEASTDHSDVDRWHAYMAGTPDPDLMPDPAEHDGAPG